MTEFAVDCRFIRLLLQATHNTFILTSSLGFSSVMDWTVTYCGSCEVDGIHLDDETARLSHP
jgi:hypothetical protein